MHIVFMMISQLLINCNKIWITRRCNNSIQYIILNLNNIYMSISSLFKPNPYDLFCHSITSTIPISGTGAQGPAGPSGAQGNLGPAGPAGPVGAQGNAGPSGPSGGPVGAQGNVGPAGPKGSQGPSGPIGPMGSQGSKGSQGPAGPAGTPGSGTAVIAKYPIGPNSISLSGGSYTVTSYSIRGVNAPLPMRIPVIDYNIIGAVPFVQVTLLIPSLVITSGTGTVPIAFQIPLLPQYCPLDNIQISVPITLAPGSREAGILTITAGTSTVIITASAPSVWGGTYFGWEGDLCITFTL